MQETAQLRQPATMLVGERLALAQEGNFAELLRRDELEANELRTRLAKQEEAEGADHEEEEAQKAAAVAVNLVQKESLTRAMKRLTSHGIASLGPSREWKGKGKSKATELDFPAFTERIRGRIRDSVRALQTAAGRLRSGGGAGQVCQPDSDSTDQRETVRCGGMQKPG